MDEKIGETHLALLVGIDIDIAIDGESCPSRTLVS